MTLRRVQDLVINRLREDPAVAHMILDEVMLNLKVGEHDTAKLLCWGVQLKTWTGLCRKSQALSILDGTERPQ